MTRGIMLSAVGLVLLAPGTAAAAGKPGVRTGAAANVAPTTATLNGGVDANGAATTYFFQIGTTTLYGANTAATPAGSRRRPVAVSVPVGTLAPATTYHYRLVAQNRRGLTKGADRTFRTRRQGLTLSLGAVPNPVAPGGAVTLAGQLSGTGNAGRQVVLQGNPFPYLQGFQPVGNALVTDAAGNFAFAVPSLAVTTQFRVVVAQKPAVVSPVVVAGVAVQATIHARKVKRHHHSVTVRFRGSISPARAGALVNVQKLKRGAWTTIAHTRARDAGAARSTYRTRIRTRGGRFRIEVVSLGDFVSGYTAERRVRVRH